MADDDLRSQERAFAAGDPEAGRRLLDARRRPGRCVFHGDPVDACAGCDAARAIDWAVVFADGVSAPEPGASPSELEALTQGLGQPLSEDELEESRRLHARAARAVPKLEAAGTHGQDPTTDPSPERWRLPDLPLPPSYLSFLAWSNGGHFQQGDRELGFLSNRRGDSCLEARAAGGTDPLDLSELGAPPGSRG